MWAPALALALLFLRGRRCEAGFSFQESSNSAQPVEISLGTSYLLHPRNSETWVTSAEWKVQLRSMAQDCLILTWKNESGLHDVKWNSGDQFSKRFNFTIKDLSLLIKAAQHQDSGIYSLEVTNDSGRTTTHYFNVSVTDPDGNSGMKEESGALDGGFGLLPLLMTIMVLITTLFFGTLVWFCVWRRKRKPPEPSPEEFLTVYEDVNNLPIRSNQRPSSGHGQKEKTGSAKEQKQEQNSPGKGNTVYSVILPQSSASTSQETATTLYSVVLPSRKSGSKKRSHSPSFISTIYEEVGRIQPKAQNPA